MSANAQRPTLLDVSRPLPPDEWWLGYIAGCARGVLAGRRRALCVVLTARFGPVDRALRGHIDRCERLSVLDDWLSRAATAPSVEAIWRPAAA